MKGKVLEDVPGSHEYNCSNNFKCEYCTRTSTKYADPFQPLERLNIESVAVQNLITLRLDDSPNGQLRRSLSVSVCSFLPGWTKKIDSAQRATALM